MLLEDNTRLAKIFLHITPEEQMRRFRARLTDPLKRWKLSYEDFRNRARWKEYEVAIEDMFETTSTDRASWYLVPANNKPFSRLAAFRIIADRLSKNVALEPPALDSKVAEAAEQLLGIRVPSENRC
jgi:polyphosphate kinase 2 (PPK2 family)